MDPETGETIPGKFTITRSEESDLTYGLTVSYKILAVDADPWTAPDIAAIGGDYRIGDQIWYSAYEGYYYGR